MNSYIFNSENHRRYVFGLLVFALTPTLGLFLLGVFLEPPYGDLTRIGSYSEREFGWSKKQLRFSQQLYTENSYSKYYDVVILGDSFSRAWPLYQWQNYFVSNTGLSVLTIDINKDKLENIIVSSSFVNTPPKILIYETVERDLAGRIMEWDPCNNFTNQSVKKLINEKLIVHQENFKNHSMYVNREKDINNIKLRFVLRYLFNNSLRLLLNERRTDVEKLLLSKDSIFSSANSQEMLVYKFDFEKKYKFSSWQKLNMEEAVCRIERIRRRVEANGHTQFVLMVAPDKLTAYSEFVKDESLRNISMLSKIMERNLNVMPRIDLALKSAIRNGEQDVYFPNDTHWGASGHRIAAEALVDFLYNEE